MKVTRRNALKSAAILGTASLAGCPTTDLPPGTDAGPDGGPSDAGMPPTDAGPVDAWAYDGGPPPTGTFQHGIASGDPLPDAVMLWTRVSEQTAAVDVTWELASDPAFADVVANGTFNTDAARDFTVKVEATGLTPATTYYYRFTVGAMTSPIGRTKTAPMGANSRLRFAFCSCSNYQFGFFHAYRRISERADLDAVIHLGDYIYEFQSGYYGSARPSDPPTEIYSLDDYRRRYAHYRKDHDLQEAHRQHPFITTWDDHEFANDAYEDGAQNHMATEGDWNARKEAAKQAYREWMPYREQPSGGIRRTLAYGDLAELIILDTRVEARTQQDTGDPATRDLLGSAQETFLFDRLMNSPAQWKIICQQVMFALSPSGTNPDQWEGYPASRQRVIDFLADNAIENSMILTGDIHCSWANDIPQDPTTYDATTGAGSVTVEMVCPAITSPGMGSLAANNTRNAIEDTAHYVRFFDPDQRGYVVLDIDATRAQGAWYFVQNIADPEAAGGVERFAAALSVAAGQTHLVTDTAAAAPIADPPDLAP
jgi:alkaline phosphatase D